MAGLDFAKRQLAKHGWKEGSGLGKQENGRSEPVKVTLKMDKTGVGHEPGKEFTDHWWLRVFNEAAQKIGKKDKVKKKEKKADKDKNTLYKGFVLSSTLTNGIETVKEKLDSSSDVDEELISDISTPTMKEIHQFCGGATGHKAARFGIKMNGKLARVAEQDRIFEEKLKQKQQPVQLFSSAQSTQLDSHQMDGMTSPSLCQTLVSEADSSGPSSRRQEKRNSKKKSNHINEAVDVQIIPLKSKHKHDKSSVIVQEVDGLQDMAAVKTKKRKCEAEQDDLTEKTSDQTTGALCAGSGGGYKKKKKKKKK